MSITTRCRERGQELARPRGQRIPRPDHRRRPGLPPPGRAAAGDRLHLGDGRARRAGTTSAPRSRRSSATPPRSSRPTPGSGLACCTPTTASRRWQQRNRDLPRRPQHRARSSTGCAPATARSSGCSTRRCSRPTTRGVPVWHGVLYDITERKRAEAELQRALAQQAVVAKLGERALQDGDPEALMRAATSLDRRSRRGPQRLHLGARPRRPPPQPPAPGSSRRWSAPAAASPPRCDSHAGAALELRHPRDRRATGRARSRFTMPPVLRVLRRRQQPGGDDRRQRPPVRRARRPRHRAAPLHAQGRALPAGGRERARRRDRAPRRRPGPAPPGPARLAHRSAQPAQLRRGAQRRRCGGRPPRARRSGSSSSTSTTSS